MEFMDYSMYVSPVAITVSRSYVVPKVHVTRSIQRANYKVHYLLTSFSFSFFTMRSDLLHNFHRFPCYDNVDRSTMKFFAVRLQ